jgi:hypothetical protein
VAGVAVAWENNRKKSTFINPAPSCENLEYEFYTLAHNLFTSRIMAKPLMRTRFKSALRNKADADAGAAFSQVMEL